MDRSAPPPGTQAIVTTYLLDTTILISQLRGNADALRFLRRLNDDRHVPSVCCVNVLEIERGLRPRERASATTLLDSLAYLQTHRIAAERAGYYQAILKKRGHTLHDADALIAGTAWAYEAVLVTANIKDFPMPDLRVEAIPS